MYKSQNLETIQIGWIYKRFHTQIMDYYTAIRMNKLEHVITWMNSTNIIRKKKANTKELHVA